MLKAVGRLKCRNQKSIGLPFDLETAFPGRITAFMNGKSASGFKNIVGAEADQLNRESEGVAGHIPPLLALAQTSGRI